MGQPAKICMHSGDPALLGPVPAGQALVGVDSTGDLPFFKNASGVTYFGVTAENVEDVVGAMVAGNTETGVAVTYNDGTGKLDFVAEVTQAELTAEATTRADADSALAIVHTQLDGRLDALEAVSVATDQELAAAVAAAQAASQPVDATLTALAGQNWAANAIPLGSAPDVVGQLALAANTFPARSSTGNVVAKPITDTAFAYLAKSSATIGADVSFTTTELILLQLRVLAGTRVIGETWNIRLEGTGPAAAGNITLKVRAGPLGTATGDPALWTMAATAGSIGSTWAMDMVASMKTATTIRCGGAVRVNVALVNAIPAAPSTVTTTADWFITVTGVMSASSCIASSGAITPA